MATIWAVAEISESVPTKLSLELATLARQLAEAAGGESRTVLIGGGVGEAAQTVADYSAGVMFPKSGQISASDTLLYNSPGENHLTGDPSRTFPDLQQIIDNNTNAVSGACPQVPPIAPPVPQDVTECFAEFLPTSDYVGFAGTNASPLSLHMKIGQISFFKMSSPVERPYGSRELGSRYQGQSSPTASQYYRDFDSTRKVATRGGPKR